MLVSAHETRYITESVALYLCVTVACIVGGVMTEPRYRVTAVLVGAYRRKPRADRMAVASLPLEGLLKVGDP